MDGDIDFLQQSLAHKNLTSLNEEENHLIHLRNQLQKIKNIREEQHKKDQYIASLKQRIAVLEEERQIHGKQNSELHIIMSERISALERYVVEKETAEKLYIQQIEELSIVTREKQSNDLLLCNERQRFHELKLLYEKAQEDIMILKSHLHSDKTLHDHFQGVVDSLRQEITGKDALFEDLRLQTSQRENSLHEEVAKLRLVTEELHSKLRISEDQFRRQELLSMKITTELENSRQDNHRLKRELERLVTGNQINENEIQTLKAQVHILEVGNSTEKDELSAEVSILKTNNEALRTELQQIRKSIADLSKTLKAIDTIYDKDEDSGDCSEISELVKAMRRALSELEGSDLHVVVSYLCQYIHFTVDQKHALDMRHGKSDKRTIDERIVRAFKEVEGRVSATWQDVVALDNIMSALEGILDKEKFMVGWNPGDTQMRDLSSSIFSKRRSITMSKLIFGINSALKKIEYYRSQEGVAQRLVSCQEELKSLQEKYQRDVAHLQRMCDEALIAVKINEMESLKTIDQLKVDTERIQMEQRDQHEAMMMKVVNGNLTQLTSEFERLALAFAYMVDFQRVCEENLERVREAYRINAKFAHGFSVLLNDMKALTKLCDQPELMSVDVQELASDAKNHDMYLSSQNEDRLISDSYMAKFNGSTPPNYRSKIVSADNCRLPPQLRTIVVVVIAANRFKNIVRIAQQSRSKQQLESIRSFISHGYPSSSIDNHVQRLILFTNDWNLPSLEEMQTATSPAMASRIIFRLQEANQVERAAGALNRKKVRGALPILPDHIRKDLSSLSLLTVLGGQSNAKFIRNLRDANNSSPSKKELFGQGELNHLHKFILESHSDRQSLRQEVKALQKALNVVEQDMRVCQRLSNATPKSSSASRRIERSSGHNNESDMDISLSLNDVSTVKFDENEWLDKITQDSRDVSRISHDSLSNSFDVMRNGGNWLVDTTHHPNNKFIPPISTKNEVQTNESIASMISRYSQNIYDIKLPISHRYRYPTDDLDASTTPFKPKLTKTTVLLDESKDRDLMDIYTDIHKLSNKVDSRLRSSSNNDGLPLFSHHRK